MGSSSIPGYPRTLPRGFAVLVARGESVERRAAWATLDVELAYPSVRLGRLRESGIAILGDEVRPLSELLIGYPQSIRDTLANSDSRQWLLQRLVDGLRAIEIDSDSVPRDGWKPHHAAPTLPPDNLGLPTGLAISGILLNLALHDTDRSVLRYLEERPADRRGAFLRFADDMLSVALPARADGSHELFGRALLTTTCQACDT